MRRLLFVAIFVLTALGIGNAQMYGGGTRMDLLQAGSSYLMIPAVQKEIGLSPAVTKKIGEKMIAATKAMTAPTNTKDRAQQQKMYADRVKKVQAVQKETIGLLTPAQKTRLKQITIQQLGPSAMTIDEVKTALKLTPAQEQKINVIIRDGMQKMFSGMQGGASNPGDFRKRMQEFQKKQEKAKIEMTASALKVMNPAQRAKWTSMQGKPFKLDMVKAMSGIMPRAAGS